MTRIRRLACLQSMWDASMKDQNILTSIITIIPNNWYKMPKAGKSIFSCSPNTRHCDGNSNHSFSLNSEVGFFLKKMVGGWVGFDFVPSSWWLVTACINPCSFLGKALEVVFHSVSQDWKRECVWPKVTQLASCLRQTGLLHRFP